MHSLLYKIKITCCLLMVSSLVFAEGFVIKDIQLTGSKGITLETLLTSVPIKKGDVIKSSDYKNILAAIYRTGFYLDANLFKDGDTLIIQVTEKPVIASINIEGNNKIKDNDLNKAFDDADIVVGGIYSVSVLDAMKRELEKVYYSFGRYGVVIDTALEVLPRDRVKIDIDIKEGRQAKIKHINIIGNNKYDDDEILDTLASGIPSWWAIFSSKDKYEKTKLESDLEALTSFYLDRGYLDFEVISTQVTISEDKKDIFIALNVKEGDQYKIKDISFTGDLIFEESDYDEVFSERIKVNDIFSRKVVNRSVEVMTRKLGQVGYPDALIQSLPKTDKVKKETSLVLQVNPGEKTYVNNISFKGNESTLDEVYRRELRQMESSLYNSGLVERSRVRIQRLPFVENVTVSEEPSLDKDDAIDLVYEIEERLAGSFTAGLGFSDRGTSFNLGISQSNLFGSGNSLALNLSQSNTTTQYRLSYSDPYYKTDNLSRALSFSFTEIDTTDFTVSTDFFLNRLSAGASYGMPLSEFSRINFGYSLGYDEISLGAFVDSNGLSQVQQIRTFLDNNDEKNNFVQMNLSYRKDKRDRQIFAKKGSLNRLSLEWLTPLSDVSYYKLSYLGEKYFYTDAGSLRLRTQIQLGDGLDGQEGLPFYEKFIIGGTRSLRGFNANSIGPREIRSDFNIPDTLGGDLSTVGSIEWLFNSSKLGNSSQISLFYDFGNAYEDLDAFDSSEFRSSFGIAYNWLAPVGPLVISYAEPIDKVEGDETERFQFTVGTSF